MVMFVLLVAILQMKEELKSASVIIGVQYVMMDGEHLMPMSYVINSDIHQKVMYKHSIRYSLMKFYLQAPLHIPILIMEVEVVQYFWTMLTV